MCTQHKHETQHNTYQSIIQINNLGNNFDRTDNFSQFISISRCNRLNRVHDM